MQTNAEGLRKGLPRKTREELPKNYKNALRLAHHFKRLTRMQGFLRVYPPGKALGVFGYSRFSQGLKPRQNLGQQRGFGLTSWDSCKSPEMIDFPKRPGGRRILFNSRQRLVQEAVAHAPCSRQSPLQKLPLDCAAK